MEWKPTANPPVNLPVVGIIIASFSHILEMITFISRVDNISECDDAL
jgi:hypothetical protein